ncbi:hypothetical protein OG308_23530 [Nocardia salmonicida]|uniref:Uncharacterized protein n=1 Tax=Nocardia salmonicida TaxID=53431 RepID=A0ABZ1N352_9NOCA
MVDQAYDLVTSDNAPDGVLRSISLGSYSAAQVAGNVATSYLSLAMPNKVEQDAELALAGMNNTNSPWGRSLIMIDVAERWRDASQLKGVRDALASQDVEK